MVELVVCAKEFLPNGDDEGSRLLLENLGFKVTESSLGLTDGGPGSDSVEVDASLDLSFPLTLILLMDMITGDGLDAGGRDLEDILTFLNLIGLLNLVLTVVFLSSISFGFTFTSALDVIEEVAKSCFLGLARDLTLFLSKVGGEDAVDKAVSSTLACCLILN